MASLFIQHENGYDTNVDVHWQLNIDFKGLQRVKITNFRHMAMQHSAKNGVKQVFTKCFALR